MTPQKIARETQKIVVFIFLFLTVFISGANADIIYLKNGRSMEGLIKNENEETVELDIGFGTVKFSREEIKSIYKSDLEGVNLIRQQWQIQNKLKEGKRRDTKQEKELEPREAGFPQTNGHIIVDALLNNKVQASLLLDTGSTFIMLSHRIAKKLGIKTHGAKNEIIKLQLADGREVDARYVILDSVNVQGLEARDVGAVVLLSDTQMTSLDGLLGMSFLNKINFQINTE